MEPPLAPGSWIGILGGGQLGRMSAQAARRLGYRVRTYDPAPGACAAAVADEAITAAWDDVAALGRFARDCGRVTLEFENIPPATVEHVARSVACHPSASVLATCQNRRREKLFLREAGIPCAPFEVVASREALPAALARIGYPAVLKTADFGYDGKGQAKLPDAVADLDAAWARMGGAAAVLEGWVPFDLEVSVLVARRADGVAVAYEPAENLHRNHILHLSLSPARIDPGLAVRAKALALEVAARLGIVGLLGVEMFVVGDRILVNELAPRPHNSGHQTLDAHATSQFEQHIRAVCGLELGDPSIRHPAVMLNLLGDLWKGGREPDWARVAREPGAHLHLYGKGNPAPGRKMGHVTLLGDDVTELVARAEALHASLAA